MVYTDLSETVINRLSLYRHYLAEQEGRGEKLVSSHDIAQVCGVTAGLVRKDLARFGKFGVKGVGYDVTILCDGIRKILGLDHTLRIAIIGIGTLGSYLLGLQGFLSWHYEIVAAFDMRLEAARGRMTSEAGKAVDILPLNLLRQVSEARQIDIAMITTVPSEAQEATDQVVQAGIRGILNFTSSYVRVPKGFIVKNIHFANVRDSLVYLLQSPQG
jgi:redox-sensing transcriptional repressor